MSLKSSNKTDANMWELELSIDGKTFNDAVEEIGRASCRERV